MTNPSGLTPIRTNEILRVLMLLAAVCTNPAAEKDKPTEKQREENAITGLVMAFLLAKRQPELCDAAAQYWSFSHAMDAEAMLDGWLDIYETMRKKDK